MDWRILQMADVAFPTGGFTLSGGLESASKLGEVSSEAEIFLWLRSSLYQTARGFLPLLNKAYDHTERFWEVNGLCQAFLTNPAANRASRLQGSAFLFACEKAFSHPRIKSLREEPVKEEGLHFAPVFGFIMSQLEVSRTDARQLFLFLGLRDALSASVRLGLLGPYRAQRIQHELSGEMERMLSDAEEEEPVQTAPLLDMFQAAHDRLEAKLFQS